MSDFSTIQEGAGKNDPLAQKGYFEASPHHLEPTMINDFDAPKIRKQLETLRRQHGADSPVGNRCSNLVQQLENHATATGQRRKDLEKHIAKSVEDLARMTGSGK